MNGAGWTPAEDAILRRMYPRATTPARVAGLKAALPRRTWHAIRVRAARLHLLKKPKWTAAEEATLRELWPDYAAEKIRRELPGRSWEAIERRASELGLERWGGFVTRQEGARRLGYTIEGFRRLLTEYSAHYRGLPQAERSVRPSPEPALRSDRRAKGSKWAHRVVDWQACLDAHEWRNGLETTAEAARRLGIPYPTLQGWLAEDGALHGNARRHRVRRDPSVYDRVAEAHKAQRDRWHERRAA